MSEEERSLAEINEAPAPVEPAIVDTTVEPTPENFDLDAWVEGVRPTRKSVKLYPSAHLVARMEELAVEIDNTPEDVNIDGLIDEFYQAKRQFHAGVWFTIEQRSSEWVQKFRKDMAKRHNLKDDEDKDAATISLYQMAEQIIQPQGVTYNHLRKLQANNEGELAKLIGALQRVNQQLAETNGVMTRDFSERRSAPDPG